MLRKPLFVALLAFPLLLAPGGCGPPPGPVIPPPKDRPEPPPPDAAPGPDGEACGPACVNMRALGCAIGQTRNGATCETRCENAIANAIDFRARCLAVAKSCSACS